MRLVLVVLAMIPGLLFRGGDSLHMCLHDWIDYQDGCTGVSESHEVAGGCCTEPTSAPDLSVATPDHECEGCCFDIRVDRTGLRTPQSADSGLALAPPPLLPVAAARWFAPPVRRIAPPAVVLAGPPPGRAPTPLRI